MLVMYPETMHEFCKLCTQYLQTSHAQISWYVFVNKLLSITSFV